MTSGSDTPKVIKGSFSKKAAFDFKARFIEREEILSEISDAYDALALLAASDYGDSSTATRVLNPINRYFELIMKDRSLRDAL